MTSLSFLQFMTNFRSSKSRIPDACSVKFTFSLKINLDRTKTKHRSKRSLTQLSYYLFELRTIFVKKGWLFTKKCCIPKIKGALVLRGIYSGTKYVCIILSFKIQVSSMIITRFRQGKGVILLPLLPQPQSEPQKSYPS